MTFIPKPTLHNRFALLLLLTFAGVSCLLYWQAQSHRDELIEAAAHDLLNNARLIAVRQQALIERGDAILNSLMPSPPVLHGKRATAACTRKLAEHLQAEPALLQIGKVAANGDVLCTANPDQPMLNIAERHWFQKVLQTPGMVAAEVIIERIHGQQAITLGKARRDNKGHVQALHFVTIRLETLFQALSTHDLPDSARISLINQQGHLLARYPDPQGWTGRNFADHPGFRPILSQGGEGVVVARSLEGIDKLYALTPLLRNIEGHNDYLWLSLPSDEVEAPARRKLIISLGIALCVLTGTLGVFYWVRQRIMVRPLRQLALAAQRFGTGDFNLREELPQSDDEIGALARSLSSMALNLRMGTVTRKRLEFEIEQHQQTARGLQNSQIALKQAVHLTRLSIWSLELHDMENFSNNPATWSEELYTLLDYTPEEIPTPSIDDFFARVHPDDQQRLMAAAKQALAEKRAWRIEYRIIRPDGREHLLAEIGEFSFDGSGAPHRMLGVIKDITVRRQTAQALEQYRHHLKELVHERTARLSEAEAEQRRLNRALRLLGDCNLALLHAEHEQALLAEICHLIVSVGGYLMAWVGFAEADAGKSVRLIAHAGDTNDYLENIRISWDENQENGCGPTGSAIRSGHSQVNQNYWSHPNMVSWRDQATQHGYQSSAALPLILEQQVLGALTVYSAEPEAFDARETGLLEELANNMAHGLQSLRARQELKRHQQQLEELVIERSSEILSLNAELAARIQETDNASRAKSAFLASMSHEIRTPLNAVIGLTGLLADSSLDRRQRDCAEKIQLSAQALRTLIDDILDFSKIEAGALRLEEAHFSLNAILRTTSAILSIGIRDKAIEALFDVAGDVPDQLIGDSLRVQQILVNLVSNAIKFTETGSIIVSVRCLAQEAETVTLQFAVRDTGIGIPTDQLGNIFDAFSQADTSISRRYGGTGLGLAICTRLLALMGGQFEVNSTIEQGSEFSFTVPLRLSLASTVAPSTPLMALSILIVDDHPQARAILQQSCANVGWQATTVDSAAACLDELQRSAAEARDYDLLLLDWRMPGMDGLEMLRRVRNLPGIGLPLVILMASAFELEEAIAASDDLYLDTIVAKPLTPATLLDAVQRAYTGEPLEIQPLPGKTDQRLLGLRLLVADDNELNQQVIEQMLSRAGAEVVIAGNGLAAVNALQVPETHFDAVLMDVEMPVMDGYSATRVIREELGRLDLPIIAVTAHAFPEAREASRRAGMVGHIVKPFDVTDLLDFLVMKRPELAVVHAQVSPADGAGDLPEFDFAAAVQAFNGDESIYADLLRQFVRQHANDPEAGQRLWDNGDSEGARQLLHTLCGAAGFLQARAVAQLAAATLRALSTGHAKQVATLFDELKTAMCRLGESVEQCTSNNALPG